MTKLSPIVSPRLEVCPATLPATVYADAGWFACEMAPVFARNWICVGRLMDCGRGTMRRVQVGASDFDRTAHGLLPAALQTWAGFVFLNTANAPCDVRVFIPNCAAGWRFGGKNVGFTAFTNGFYKRWRLADDPA